MFTCEIMFLLPAKVKRVTFSIPAGPVAKIAEAALKEAVNIYVYIAKQRQNCCLPSKC